MTPPEGSAGAFAPAAPVGGTDTDAAIHAAQQTSVQLDELSAAVADNKSQLESLNEALAQVANVAQEIDHIAKQTNLLALNATIEAARAGEAGKGFAVVANEVKTRAGQVADATTDIEGHIGSIMGASERTGSSINDIDTRMQDMRGVTSAIASAIQQQSAATSEISNNVQQTASGAKDISANCAEITAASEKTGTGAKGVLDSARGLSQEADQLRASVKEFLEKIAAA